MFKRQEIANMEHQVHITKRIHKRCESVINETSTKKSNVS